MKVDILCVEDRCDDQIELQSPMAMYKSRELDGC